VIFNDHSNLVGEHAFLGASKYHWINYSEDKMLDSYRRQQATLRGIELHDFAARCIKLRQKLPDLPMSMNMYVNDAIGFKMTPEQVLYYSEYCFGTADTISFRDDFLRIHDFKSGEIPGRIEQLIVYAALFCLEYKIKPASIGIELRLYQFDTVQAHLPAVDEIVPVMDRATSFTKALRRLKE
jgi:hypothetical protein